MNMDDSSVELNDLPDEILVIILRKLNNFDIHYSLQGVNQRLNQIIRESIFTNRLSFIKKSSDNFVDRLSDKKTFDRFCLQILPQIHYKIKWLDVESVSMKSILRAFEYPNLNILGLYNIDEESARSLVIDQTLSTDIFTNQIETLILTCIRDEDYVKMLSSVANIFECIFPIFTKLIDLILHESSYRSCVRLNFNDSLILNFRSTMLLNLKINAQSYRDCLYILDGRFNQLQTLIIDLVNIWDTDEIENQSDLPNLKYFSLSCSLATIHFNETIVPLLSRMSNLKQLYLYVEVQVDSDETFIDGNYLKKNIFNSMKTLHRFEFSIISHISRLIQLNLSLMRDIQQTFIDFPTKNIISYVDYFPKSYRRQCHIYSYPSQMKYYNNITNRFQGGIFKYVHIVSLFDEKPFEHEFFARIQKSFPFMKMLRVTNEKPQNRKESNENLSRIEYSSLREICIDKVHDDYIEEFQFDTKTYLSNNIELYVTYESLERVTNSFTRESTRINCAKIDKLYFVDESKHSNSLKEYFPNVKIFSKYK